MNEYPRISIVIPCRNEERFISGCLDSLLKSDFPRGNMEVIVVDGKSDDGTRELIEKYAEEFPFIRLLHNEKKVTPVALNLGVRAARGEYIMILSSHCKVDRNFVGANVAALDAYQADCVGGILHTLPANDTVVAKAIAAAVSHPFGVGNAHFRIGERETRYVDTVPFGCYRREVFDRVGLFEESLVRNQDDEFNLRLIRHGGKVLLVPEIVSYYFARDSLSKLWRMYYQYGAYKPRVALKVGGVLTLRQVIPALFVGAIIVSAAISLITAEAGWLLGLIVLSYLCANIFFSVSVSLKKGLALFPVLLPAFATLHLSYGWGYLRGAADILLGRKQAVEDVPLTR